MEAPVERVPLGRLLVDAGFLTRTQLDDCLFEGSKTGERIGEVVVRRDLATEDDIARLLAEQWGLDYVERSAIWFDGNALAKLSKEDAQRWEALPTRIEGGRVVVAVAEPTEQRLAAVRDLIGEETVLIVVPKSALDAGLRSSLLASRGGGQFERDPEPEPEPEPRAAGGRRAGRRRGGRGAPAAAAASAGPAAARPRARSEPEPEPVLRPLPPPKKETRTWIVDLDFSADGRRRGRRRPGARRRGPGRRRAARRPGRRRPQSARTSSTSCAPRPRCTRRRSRRSSRSSTSAARRSRSCASSSARCSISSATSAWRTPFRGIPGDPNGDDDQAEMASAAQHADDPVVASYRQLAEIYHDLLSREDPRPRARPDRADGPPARPGREHPRRRGRPRGARAASARRRGRRLARRVHGLAAAVRRGPDRHRRRARPRDLLERRPSRRARRPRRRDARRRARGDHLDAARRPRRRDRRDEPLPRR